jgi:SAM-dependent methyltransferase
MRYSIFDHAIRRFVPSTARISFNPVVKAVGNSIAYAFSLPFPELRDLPPNHLRIRVGVENRLLANHIHHLQMGYRFWLSFFSRHYCKPDSDIVELGCGCGRIAYPLREDWFEGTYVGVDVDQEMIEYCRRSFNKDRFKFILSTHASKTYSSGRPRPQMRPDHGLSISDHESKDFIFSVSLYSHLLEPEVVEYLTESFDILRPGGAMFLSFFCIDHIERGSRWTFMHRRGNAFIENEKYPEAAVAYQLAYMVDLVRKIGFREVSVAPMGIQSELLARK